MSAWSLKDSHGAMYLYLWTLAGVRAAPLRVGRGGLAVGAEDIGANNVLTKLTP